MCCVWQSIPQCERVWPVQGYLTEVALILVWIKGIQSLNLKKINHQHQRKYSCNYLILLLLISKRDIQTSRMLSTIVTFLPFNLTLAFTSCCVFVTVITYPQILLVYLGWDPATKKVHYHWTALHQVKTCLYMVVQQMDCCQCEHYLQTLLLKNKKINSACKLKCSAQCLYFLYYFVQPVSTMYCIVKLSHMHRSG